MQAAHGEVVFRPAQDGRVTVQQVHDLLDRFIAAHLIDRAAELLCLADELRQSFVRGHVGQRQHVALTRR